MGHDFGAISIEFWCIERKVHRRDAENAEEHGEEAGFASHKSIPCHSERSEESLSLAICLFIITQVIACHSERSEESRPS